MSNSATDEPRLARLLEAGREVSLGVRRGEISPQAVAAAIGGLCVAAEIPIELIVSEAAEVRKMWIEQQRKETDGSGN